MSDEIDVLTRKPPAYDSRLKYGADPNQFGDLRLPSSKPPHPLIIFIHGGFWRARYDLSHAGHLCVALAKVGIATFNLEYRRVGNPGGGWPGTFEDVVAGFKFIQQHAQQQGLHPKQIAVAGHSAGGELALCLASREPSLCGAASLAGVVDVRRAWELHLSNNAAAQFMGGTPAEVPEHYREGSPFELKIAVRQILLHGKKDDIVPFEFSSDYVHSKRAAGEKVELITFRDAGHFDLIDPQSAAWPKVSEALTSLVA